MWRCSVGKELIKGNWKEAVRLLMSGHEGERADSAQARALFQDGDVSGALKQMPRHQTVERAILEARSSFQGSVGVICRPDRVHAACTYSSPGLQGGTLSLECLRDANPLAPWEAMLHSAAAM